MKFTTLGHSICTYSMGVLAGGEGAQELQLEEGDGELRGEPGEDQHPQESRTRQHQDHQVTVHTIFFSQHTECRIF